MSLSIVPSNRKRRRHKANRKPVGQGVRLAAGSVLGTAFPDHEGPMVQFDHGGAIARSLPRGAFTIAFLPRFERWLGCNGTDEFTLWRKYHPLAKCTLQEGSEENGHGWEVWTIDYADSTALIDLGARRWVKASNLSHGYSLPTIGSGAGAMPVRSSGKVKPGKPGAHCEEHNRQLAIAVKEAQHTRDCPKTVIA